MLRFCGTAIFISFMFGVHLAEGQTRTIDMLKSQVYSSTSAPISLQALFALCDQGYNLHPDTLMKFATQAKTLAIEQKRLADQVKAMYYQSYALTNKGLIDSSLKAADECLKLLNNEREDPVLIANILNQKGRCYMRMNKYKEAIDMGFKVITEAEKGGDQILQIKGKTLVGWAYLEIGSLQEALSWHLKALRTSLDPRIVEKYGILFANLALNYSSVGKLESALFYINKGINSSRKHENLFALSNSLAIQAQLFVKSGQGKLAEAPLKEVVQIRKLIGDPFYIVSDMSQLASFYARNNETEKGVAVSNEGIEIAKKYNLPTKLLFLYTSLAENYKAGSSFEKYGETLEKIITLKDSIYQLNSAESLAEMEAKYTLEKKENTIMQQDLQLAKQQENTNAILLVSTIVLALAVTMFLIYKQKQKVKLQWVMFEEKRLATEAVFRAEENERKRIAADLHDNMGAYVSAISANVDELIMQSPSSKAISNIKKNAAEIMLNLRDTIWVLNKESISITELSDRIKTFIHKISDSYPSISIVCSEEITHNITLSPEQGLNILRIMQEALHNAFKHSRATAIDIRIVSNNSLSIMIVDNGQGSQLHASYDGNGIINMKERAKASGFKIKLAQLQPKGVEMLLTNA